MFSLNKSLAQLKSALEVANLAKKEAAANGEKPAAKSDKQKAAPKRKRGVTKKNVCISIIFLCFCVLVMFLH